MFWPILLGRRIFAPRIRIDRVANALAMLRSLAALATLAVLALAFGDAWEDIGNQLARILVSACCLFPVALIAWGLAYLRTRDRVFFSQQVKRPLLLTGFAVASPLVLWALLTPVSALFEAVERSQPPGWLLWLSWLPVFWVAQFVFASVLYVTKSFFASSDIHPLLPPLMAPWFSLSLAALEFQSFLTAGTSLAPQGVSRTVALTGAGLGTLLAVMEYGRIRSVYRTNLAHPPCVAVDEESGRPYWTPCTPT